MLATRLPRDACFRTTPEKRLGATEEWTNEMQLLALLIEVVSIRVAGKQIKKPIDIPRPGKGKGGRRHHPDDPGMQRQGGPAPAQHQAQTPAPSRDAAFKQGISVLYASRKSRR